MPARNRTRSFTTRKTSSSHLNEIKRRVAMRGGTRHVQDGALKLQVPRNFVTGELVP